MIKIILFVYGTSGLVVDTLVMPSMDKCVEMEAKMTMIEFSMPATERFRYECKPITKKMGVRA